MSQIKQIRQIWTKKRSLSTPCKTKKRLQHLVFKITYYTTHSSMRLHSPTAVNIGQINSRILTIQVYFIDKSRQQPVFSHLLAYLNDESQCFALF